MILIIEGTTWKVENQIKMNLKDRGWEKVNWSDLAQVRNKWSVRVNTAMN